MQTSTLSATEILRQRYARGEIDTAMLATSRHLVIGMRDA